MNLGAPALIVLTLSSVLVACWEEILYRGVFVNAISDWKGTRAAVWGSSFLFTIMHVQAQPHNPVGGFARASRSNSLSQFFHTYRFQW